MNKTFFSATALCLAAEPMAQTALLSPEIQIKTAVLAGTADRREAGKVHGSAPDGSCKVLRAGNNDMVCIADDPKKEDVNVSCYFAGLDAFMERGRVLAKEGKNPKEIFDIREKEVKDGKL